jgi:hypothetical protein
MLKECPFSGEQSFSYSLNLPAVSDGGEIFYIKMIEYTHDTKHL